MLQLQGVDCDKCLYASGLTMGSSYYLRVFAANSMGLNPVVGATAATTATPQQVAGAPTSVSLAVVSATELEVFFSHLNHSNPAVFGDSAENREIERRGFAVLTEGQRIPL